MEKENFIINSIRCNGLQTYIETNFHCQSCLVSNIIHFVSTQMLDKNESIDLLLVLVDGLGIERFEIESIL